VVGFGEKRQNKNNDKGFLFGRFDAKRMITQGVLVAVLLSNVWTVTTAFSHSSPTTTRTRTVTSTSRSTTNTALRSTRSSPYRTVDGAGPTLRDTPYGQRWEGQAPTFQQRFAEQKMRQGQPYAPPFDINNNILERERDPMPRFPREQPQIPSPLTRYADRYNTEPLPPPPPLAVEDEDARPFFGTRPSFPEEPSSMAAFQRPNPPTFLMPMNSKEIQGGSRGTWISHDTLEHDEVTIKLTTPDGRPLKADVEVYNGPSNTPQKMRIYSEDGRRRPFTTMIATPSGATKTHALLREWESPMASIRGPSGGTTSHSISVKNTGPIEFPIVAGVEGSGTVPDGERAARMADYAGRSSFFWGKKQEIHGGHLQTYPFDPSVGSVQVEIHSQGLPIMAVLELWNGPGDVKTVAQIYNDDGQTKPFKCIIETPGGGNVIAIRNVGPTAYPFEVELDVVAMDDSAYSYPFQGGGGGGAAVAGLGRGGPRY
jgi:hypothetical protein